MKGEVGISGGQSFERIKWSKWGAWGEKNER